MRRFDLFEGGDLLSNQPLSQSGVRLTGEVELDEEGQAYLAGMTDRLAHPPIQLRLTFLRQGVDESGRAALDDLLLGGDPAGTLHLLEVVIEHPRLEPDDLGQLRARLKLAGQIISMTAPCGLG
jgi:hypothetical protein